MPDLGRYELVFSDEFNTLSLFGGTSGTWKTTYYYGDHTLPANAERQYYVDPAFGDLGLNPFSAQNGVLTISAQPAPEALKPTIGNLDYTSGLISSERSFAMQYGYFEMRAQLPGGKGLWPAFWMLPVDGSWPPELDIMEMIGSDPTSLFTTVHSKSSGAHRSVSKATTVADLSAGFHTYGVDWGPDIIAWYFDGQKVFETATPADLHQPMYMIANLAVGGTWPGLPNATTWFPAEMKIDYVRAYQRPADHAAVVIPPHWSSIDLTKFSTVDGSGAKAIWEYRYVMSSTDEKLKLMHDWSRYATGNDRANYIEGSNAQYNELDGGKGNDVLKGNGGTDLFVVRAGDGSDVIVDLTNSPGNTDKIRLEGFHFRHFNDVKPWLVQVGADVLLRLDQDQALLLKNVKTEELRSEQFVFLNSTNTPLSVQPSSGLPAPRVVEPPAALHPDHDLVPAIKKIVATNASEQVMGTDLDEWLQGRGGHDTIDGRSGNDVLDGGSGSDRLHGRIGQDILRGGGGVDVLSGGNGADAFVFETRPGAANLDRITDFDPKSDSIWLDSAVFKKLGSPSAATAPVKIKDAFWRSGDKAKDKNDYIIYNPKTGALFYDADGSGAGAAVQIAKLDKFPKLTAHDFLVI